MSTWKTIISGETWTMIEESDLTSPESFVLIALHRFIDGNGNGARPSIGTLCRMTKLGRRTIVRALAGLEAKGFVTRDRRPGLCNRYTLTYDRAALVPERHGCQNGIGDVPERHGGHARAAHDQEPVTRARDQEPAKQHQLPKIAAKKKRGRRSRQQILEETEIGLRAFGENRPTVEQVLDALDKEDHLTDGERRGIVVKLAETPDGSAAACEAFMDRGHTGTGKRAGYLLKMAEGMDADGMTPKGPNRKRPRQPTAGPDPDNPNAGRW